MKFTDEQLKQLQGLIGETVKDLNGVGGSTEVDNTPPDTTPADTPDIQLQVNEMGKSIQTILDVLQKDLPSLKSAGYFTDDGGTADPAHKSFGDFLLAVKRGDIKRIREVYGSRPTSEVWTEPDARKDMSGESGSAGSYLIPHEYSPNLMQVAAEQALVRSRATVIPVGSSGGSFPALDQYAAPTAGQGDTALAGGVVVTWAGEGSAGAETEPAFKMIEYAIRKIAAFTEVPNEFAADSAVGIEALLTSLFGIAVTSMEDYAFIRGDGVGKPLGFLNAPAAIGVTTTDNNVFAYADALKMRAQFKAVGGSPIWAIHQGLWPDIGVFEVSTGSGGVFQANLSAALNQTILGMPIVESEHLPQDDNAGDANLVDLRAYIIFDRAGIAVAYSEHAAFTSDKGTWRVTKRLDGQPWMKGPITLADPQGSYQVSPFVYHND